MPIWQVIIIVAAIAGAMTLRARGVSIIDIIGKNNLAMLIALAAGVLAATGVLHFYGGSAGTKLESWTCIGAGVAVAVLVFLGARLVF